MSLPQNTTASSSATADTEMFDEQQDYIRSLERLSQPADPLGASAFPNVKVDVDEDMTMTTSSSATATEHELGFGERFPEEEEKVSSSRDLSVQRDCGRVSLTIGYHSAYWPNPTHTGYLGTHSLHPLYSWLPWTPTTLHWNIAPFI